MTPEVVVVEVSSADQAFDLRRSRGHPVIDPTPSEPV